MDSLVTVTLGIVKGIGQQAQAMIAYLICFYLISVPASYYICFNLHLGLRGLYYGLSTGLIILLISLFFIIKRADWFGIA
jgi:MATE family multidrug resistance protein